MSPSNSNAVLRFLPWMRRGLVRSLATPAVDGLPTSAAAVVRASVRLGTERIARDVRLRGPGDVVGLSTAQVARVDPVDGTLDFEPNYFPTVELVAPDLPWMFTPAAPDDDKLVPWLVLVVVAEQEGVALTSGTGPLPVLRIEDPADASRVLPDLTDAWAWAHVQSATEISPTRTPGDAYAAEPEAFLARLMCPRHLDASTSYLACVVPVFEAGRCAGLGLSVDPDTAALAWSNDIAEIELPVYYSWRFSTGPDGDFEALVRRLTPRELDAGVHDLDIGNPGSSRLPVAPGTLVSFAGALVSPAVRRRVWKPTHKAAFQQAMRTLLNELLTSDGAAPPQPYDPLRDDPLVGPPAYGALPAAEDTIPVPLDNGKRAQPVHQPVWLADANLDPVARSAAGLGAAVVQRNQEALMASAWTQASALRDVNRVLNWSRLAAEVGTTTLTNRLMPLDDGALIQVAGTAHGRLPSAAGVGTVKGQLAAAAVPTGVTSAAFRRITRRGGPVGRGLALAETQHATAARIARNFTTDLETSMSFAAFVRPLGAQLSDSTMLAGLPGLPSDWDAGARTSRTRKCLRLISAPTAGGATIVRDAVAIELPTATGGFSPDVAGSIRSGLDPVFTLGAKLRARITAPASAWGTALVPATMAAEPTFPDPLSDLLARFDPELLLPGAGEIPDDTVGLVQVNAAFVEAFLLGANNALALEFLWREYPVDLTGTWLRTFWDAIDGAVPDIGAIAGWTPGRLGTHQVGSTAGGSLVLVIKGGLLRRYPDTVIYALEAQWTADKSEREPAPGGERRDPVFGGSLGRGLSFLGFDLTRAEALGAVDTAGMPIPGGAAGWFFVFEQPPIGARFGLDVGRESQSGASPNFWKNVSWAHQVDDFATLAELAHARADGRLNGVRRRYDEDAFSRPGARAPLRWRASPFSGPSACWSTPARCCRRTSHATHRSSANHRPRGGIRCARRWRAAPAPAGPSRDALRCRAGRS
jgi:hypothetical protein